MLQTVKIKKALMLQVVASVLCFSTFAGSPNFLSHAIQYPVADTVPAIASITSTDSSKLFKSLLAPSVSNSAFNFQMNADAKFFSDDYIKKHTEYYNKMKVWGKPYFALYDRILSSYGIPVQLKYLSVIESSLSSTAVSWAGAVGPWQIMSDAAHEHGLNTNYYTDDRFDYIKSTNAACKILKELYATYGDWLLVIAAYNAGAGNVNRAISKAHSKNFWDIQYYLPLETRNHVKKFIATHYFFEGDGSTVTLTGGNAAKTITDNNLPKDEYMQLASSCTTVNIYGKYNSVVIANALMMDISIFNRLNPDIDNVLAKGDIYPLRIPADKADLFQAKKTEILRESVETLLNASSAVPVTGSK
jgi:membrane-bound lytic murein transglycosylase D